MTVHVPMWLVWLVAVPVALYFVALMVTFIGTLASDPGSSDRAMAELNKKIRSDAARAVALQQMPPAGEPGTAVSSTPE